ncbi:hypothetical protein H0H93_008182 [Arthromyces matolae]|nr:hypothetical protein H0H93_008182 [Arthromyces matolae]
MDGFLRRQKSTRKLDQNSRNIKAFFHALPNLECEEPSLSIKHEALVSSNENTSDATFEQASIVEPKVVLKWSPPDFKSFLARTQHETQSRKRPRTSSNSTSTEEIGDPFNLFDKPVSAGNAPCPESALRESSDEELQKAAVVDTISVPNTSQTEEPLQVEQPVAGPSRQSTSTHPTVPAVREEGPSGSYAGVSRHEQATQEIKIEDDLSSFSPSNPSLLRRLAKMEYELELRTIQEAEMHDFNRFMLIRNTAEHTLRTLQHEEEQAKTSHLRERVAAFKRYSRKIDRQEDETHQPRNMMDFEVLEVPRIDLTGSPSPPSRPQTPNNDILPARLRQPKSAANSPLKTSFSDS